MTPSFTPGLPLAILIPVLNRPHLVRPLVSNIRAVTDSRHQIVFVCTAGDQAEITEVKSTGCAFIVRDFPDKGQYATKINTAYRETNADWVFCAADDLVFYTGWDTQALRVGETRNAGVVGTQDRHNPLVVKGKQSTHSLVKRTYIEQHGGTFDHTGAIYCELYDHQFVDIELVETAKARGKWAFSNLSVVEHMHPHWKLGVSDATYEKATRATSEDMLLFQQRMRLLRNRGRNSRRAAL